MFLLWIVEAPMEATMDRVTRCLHCGKRTVPTPGLNGRTELKFVYCEELDPPPIKAAEWAGSPLAKTFPEPAR